jgi:wobble nucleotide-excising tRNase
MNEQPCYNCEKQQECMQRLAAKYKDAKERADIFRVWTDHYARQVGNLNRQIQAMEKENAKTIFTVGFGYISCIWGRISRPNQSRKSGGSQGSQG